MNYNSHIYPALNNNPMSRFMRMLVFFDLPVQTKRQRSEATRFRNFLLKDGYYMVQYSVYARTCNSYDSVNTHKMRLSSNLPNNGSIRLLTITEKQYLSIDVLIGKLTNNEILPTGESLTLF